MRSLTQRGICTVALTSAKHGLSEDAFEVINDIAYYRTSPRLEANTSGILGQIRSIRLTSRSLKSLIDAISPDIVHAHSPCLNGLAAIGNKVPLIYEIRSSWEDAAVSEGTTTEGSIRYRLSRFLETFVARKADEIVVICDGLRHELESRGIDRSRITVVQNAIQDDMLKLATDVQVAAVRETHGLSGCKVIGYFGSFFRWEGIEDLIRAMPAIRKEVPGAKLLLVGGGKEEAARGRKTGGQQESESGGKVRYAKDTKGTPRVNGAEQSR